MAITETSYLELMKNCSKFNARITQDRKNRFPIFDQQTSTAHRPSPYYMRKPEQRYPSTNPDYVCSYPAIPWKRPVSAPPSDAIEMKMFLHNNPALSNAISNAQQEPLQTSAPIGNLEAMLGSAENSMDTSMSDRRLAQSLKREAGFEDYEDELDDLSDDFVDSDDDFGSSSKKKRKKETGTGKGRKKASAAAGDRGGGPSTGHSNTTNASKREERPDSAQDEKKHACNQCGARYKSRPGLSYHKAHVHGDGVAASGPAPLSIVAPSTPRTSSNTASSSACSSPAILPPPVIFSPSVDISDTCDLCDGTRLENKSTKQPEELVTCHDCGRSAHPTCVKFSENMKVSTSKFGWQCIECKSCAICGTSDNDDKLLFCDDCDRGFHLYCLKPPLENPPDDAWSCHLCLKVFGPNAAARAAKK